MKVNTTKDGVTLKLSIDEAVALEAVLGGFRGPIARALPWYDAIANALEHEKHNLLSGRTISQAVEERFVPFHCAPTFFDGDNWKVDETRAVER
jgi:hypothetical protein